MSRLFTAALYLAISLIAFVIDFPFYPVPVALLIIAVTTALAYSGHVKLGFAIMTILLIPALLYVYKYAALGVLLLILILLILIRVFDWLGVGVGMLAWEFSIMPNPLYVLSVPLILTSPSLTIGVTKRVTPLKSLITFLILYIPTLLLLNANNAVTPWFGYVSMSLSPLQSLTAGSIMTALGSMDVGLYGLSQAISRVFTWASTYVLPPIMALAAYIAYVVSSKLRSHDNKVVRFLAPAVGTMIAYALMTYLLFYMNPYFGLYQGIDVNTLMQGVTTC